ncbi:phage portal protein [Desulfobacula toluolica]|uniref:Phage portal protein, lambda family n=1 Tax=Desulfobacula toluolica (strain DSM 7467 / Tol2) TaxID=651182 RepID=K0NIH4_DESTT|nr:phage portal protein [Desulfobacula toluolica]CCK81206.1 phage portal protein, lambda family [Desulfobacula toluolica Tol2]
MSGNPPVLYGPDNRPLRQTGAKPYGSYEVSRVAGGLRGTLSNWFVSRNTAYSARMERQVIADRAEDLAANDTHAASSIDSIAVNSVGTGLQPQSRPNAKVLGWNEVQSREFQTQAEWAWHIWQQESDAAGRLSFWQNCLVAIRTMLIKGEFFRIPLMINRPGRVFSLALQAVDPLRVYTPSDLTEKENIKDGVEFGEYGMPTGYWVADPDDAFINYDLASCDFTKVRAKAGHRPGAIHNFIAKTEEQVRGVSILAPAMKFFKDLNDYLEFEVVGAIIASSFPVFIETSDPYGTAEGMRSADPNAEKTRYHESVPGTVLYGNINEKPHVLKSDRPGNSFDAFVERILRAIGASIGMPYEVIAKDFSKTNYSSARAALLEAGRVFAMYQKWMVDGFCQPVWSMVLEEAWLRGMIVLPKGSPDWYDAVHAYTRATWIPPRKGNVDPLKEIKANILAIQHNISTLAGVTAEIGGGDYEANLQQRSCERKLERKLDIIPPAEVKKQSQKEPSDDSEK